MKPPQHFVGQGKLCDARSTNKHRYFETSFYCFCCWNWLTQILKNTLVLFWSTVAVLLLKIHSLISSFHHSFFSPQHLQFCQSQNCFGLFHYNLLKERSICEVFSYLDIHHIENSLKPRIYAFLYIPLSYTIPIFIIIHYHYYTKYNIIFFKFHPFTRCLSITTTDSISNVHVIMWGKAAALIVFVLLK